jgi:hypothetical protein
LTLEICGLNMFPIAYNGCVTPVWTPPESRL